MMPQYGHVFMASYMLLTNLVCTCNVQVANFALWINNSTEYQVNLAQVAGFLKSATGRMPFIVWRDASVQHFQVQSMQGTGSCTLRVWMCFHMSCSCTSLSSSKLGTNCNTQSR
jgi:hypothetical protein